MAEVGDVAFKLSGRDAGNICVVISNLENNFVLIEGNTRRKKCNLKHLQFLGKNVDIKKEATREEVINALKKEDLKIKEVKKGKSRERKQRQTKRRINAMNSRERKQRQTKRRINAMNSAIEKKAAEVKKAKISKEKNVKSNKENKNDK